jgi:hypothetical protein
MKEEKLKLQAMAKESKLELTPELLTFAWLVKHHALIDFWESAARQAKYQHETLERFLEKEKNT